ncbi:MAG: M16 family metallopeptidase, partial [bacterium]
HATFLDSDYNRALELIGDILINSTFPENELQKEKEVIINEINSYKDSPSELIFDEFEELIFQGQPIGKNILGSPETLTKFSREDITGFINREFNTDQMVISSTGNIRFSKLVKIVEKYFGEIPANTREKSREKFTNYLPIFKSLEKNTYQTHCLIGNIAYDVRDEKRIGLQVLNNLLGGYGLNSRLNMSLREKRGYAYNVESNYNPYFDTGVLTIYFGTEKEHLNKSIKVVYQELEKLKTKKLGILQLGKAKKQLMGQIAISVENHENLMQAIGKSLLIYDEVDSLQEVYKKIECVTSAQLLDIANEILDKDKLSTLIYK